MNCALNYGNNGQVGLPVNNTENNIAAEGGYQSFYMLAHVNNEYSMAGCVITYNQYFVYVKSYYFYVDQLSETIIA